jgi:hypothetical protein
MTGVSGRVAPLGSPDVGGFGASLIIPNDPSLELVKTASL